MFVTDMAYVAPPHQTETPKVYKTRLYKTQAWFQRKINESMEMRIIRKYPDIQWNKVWKNLQAAPVTIEVKDTWYKAIHDILPTNKRLADARIIDNDKCAVCSQRDTVIHRITTCGEGPVLWTRTRVMMGYMLRMDPKRIPQAWILHPDFQHWPGQKHAASLWLLASLVHYCLQGGRRLSLNDYMDFLRRARWRLYQHTKGTKATGNYLDVLDWD
jgi:hypothetical protein